MTCPRCGLSECISAAGGIYTLACRDREILLLKASLAQKDASMARAKAIVARLALKVSALEEDILDLTGVPHCDTVVG